MRKKILAVLMFLILVSAATFLSGCSGGGSHSSSDNHSDSESRSTVTKCLVPEASGKVVYNSGQASIDASNTSEGYVMVRHQGGNKKVKLQITTPDGTTYTYNLSNGSYEAFPLSGGNGSYQVDVLENAHGNMYAVALSKSISVGLSDEFKPYLYPNQYVWFTSDDEAVSLAESISDKSSNDLDFVEQIYYYVIDNISYDDDLAENVGTDYLPDIDRTLNKKKGICFDYASLMSAMLRAQGIPTKLVVGYSGDAYHAWISVYLTEVGWVDNIIEFDGHSWSLMDPTLAANNDSKSVSKYIGDGSNYQVKYSY